MATITHQKKNILFTVALWLLAIVSPTAADPIEGVYAIEGSPPGGSAHYKGEAMVKRTGEIYSVAWKIGAQVFIGTGLVRDQVFSVAFRDGRTNAFVGVASFRIENDKVRGGAWAQLGSKQMGSETWAFIQP
jgi:hypothetical protein